MATGLDVVRDRRRALAVAGVFVLGAALRLYDLTGESLVNDEFHTIGDLRAMTSLGDVPLAGGRPLFYLLMKPWVELVGYGELALRLPSAVFGALTVLAAYALGRELAGHRVGLGAAGLIAVSPYFITHAQQARMYALLPLLALVSTWALVRLLRDGVDRRTAAVYLATSALLGYTHVYGLLLVAGHTAYVALAGLAKVDLRFRGPPRTWLGLQAGLAALLAPVLVAIAGRLAADAAGSGQVLFWNVPPGPYRVAVAVVRPFHYTLAVVPVVVLAGAIVAGLAVAVRRAGRRGALALPLTLAGWSIAVAALVSHLVTPIFFRRYLIGAGALLVVGAVRAVETVEDRRRRRLVALALAVLVLQPLPGYYAGTDKQQWRQGAAMLEDAAGPDDLILVTPAHAVDNVRYYYDGPAALQPLDPDVDAATLDGTTRGHPSVWLVTFRSVHGTAQYRTILAALNESRRPVVAVPSDAAVPVPYPRPVDPYDRFVGFDVYRFDAPTTAPAEEPAEGGDGNRTA